jgi:hypothetical protein
MPGRSALCESVYGEAGSWSNLEYMLAALIDKQEITNWMFVEANKADTTDNPAPQPYPRPGQSLNETLDEEPVMANAADIAAFLASLNS